MAWNTLEHDLTFRLVVADTNIHLPAFVQDRLEQLRYIILWRQAQLLPEPQLYVIKLGYSSYLQAKENIFPIIYQFFLDNKTLFNNKPVRFAIYQEVNTCDTLTWLPDYQIMAQKLQEDNIYCTVSWIWDKTDDTQFLNSIQGNHLHHVVLFKSAPSIEIIDQLEKSGKISGYDILGRINNISNNIENNQMSLVEETLPIIKKRPEFSQKLVPELTQLLSDKNLSEQSIKEHIMEFCQNGFLIHNNEISPLIYGSADDFSLPSKLFINDFLMLTYNDVTIHIEKLWLKHFLKSYCSQCQYHCQKIMWLNHGSADNCQLGIKEFFDDHKK